MQAVSLVLPVCTVPSLHVALVVSGVTAFLVAFAAFFVPFTTVLAACFAASAVSSAALFVASFVLCASSDVVVDCPNATCAMGPRLNVNAHARMEWLRNFLDMGSLLSRHSLQ